MNLGLDLKGGMNVILEVSRRRYSESSFNYNPDKTFTEARPATKVQYQTQAGADYLTLFGRAFQKSIRMQSLLPFSEPLS